MRTFLATILVLAAPAVADTVHLRDGRTVDGTLKRNDATSWVVLAAGRKPVVVADVDVASIVLTARPATEAGRLDAVRRSVAHVDIAADALDRYRRLIAAGGDPATLATARSEMAVWQDRADRGLVRLGDRWVIPAAREQAQADALVTANHARQAIKDGRFADAAPLATAALAMDPQCASAHYLLGLVRADQNRLSAARREFEAAAALVPNHGATLVNLAVIDWEQHRYADALARYDAAMVAAPADAAVLADVAVAVGHVPPTVAKLPAVARLVGRVSKRYHDQQKQMTDRMTALGLHPFGSAWLTDDQLDQVRQGQQQDQQKLDALAADFDKAQDQVRQTDLAIADVQDRQRRSADAGSVGPYLASYDGVRPGLAVPAVYYELQNDADQLQRRRAQQVGQLDALQKQAAVIHRRMDGQTDSDGAQHLIGPDGTPVRLPAATPSR